MVQNSRILGVPSPAVFSMGGGRKNEVYISGNICPNNADTSHTFVLTVTASVDTTFFSTGFFSILFSTYPSTPKEQASPRTLVDVCSHAGVDGNFNATPPASACRRPARAGAEWPKNSRKREGAVGGGWKKQVKSRGAGRGGWEMNAKPAASADF